MARGKGQGKPDEIVIFSIVRNSACAECGAELWKGAFLRMEEDRPICLSCADLDHLVFLPRGDTALTRRASKHSRLRAVVVRFSRARRRYERQGILVEPAALDRAEEECLKDADRRALARERAAERRTVEDAEHEATFAKWMGDLYPHCPRNERAAIARHACVRSSGRVGRSAAARQFDPSAIDLAVRAHVRHEHTPYDELLASGRDRHAARARVVPRVEEILAAWRGRGAP